jgi:hypothetical protein
VPVEVEPPELARLVDFAERPRTHDWSLRAALVRYAQPEPVRVNRVLEHVRRIDFALGKQRKLLEREGPAIWAALASGADGAGGEHADVVALLQVTAELDRLGDALAAWAVDRAVEQPDAQVDEVTADVERRLDELGIPREERTRPPRSRG